MIKYGLKLWTNNKGLFKETVLRYQRREFDFVELYHNAHEEIDFKSLKILNELPVFIHNTSDLGFHEFRVKTKQLKIWQKTKKLADYFDSPYIIVHSGKSANFKEFGKNLEKIDDPRILVENMAGLDIYGDSTFGYSLPQLKKIKKRREICFDLEKAVKAACYQKISYKNFISQCTKQLKPFYFHISGGNKNDPMDEHKDLKEANFDLGWIKRRIKRIYRGKNAFLVFEVPRKGNNLENDVRNIDYFKR